MANKFYEGFLFGGLLGFLSGILLAPKSGSELRKQIAESSDDLYQTATDSIGGIKEKTNQTLQDIQYKGGEVLRKASDTFEGTKETLSHKLEELTNQSSKVLVDDIE